MEDHRAIPRDALIGTADVAARLGWKRTSVHVMLGRARTARAAGREHWFPEPACIGPRGNLWRQWDIDAVPPVSERRIGGRPPIRAGNRYVSRENNRRTIELEQSAGKDAWIVKNVTHPDPTKVGNRSTVATETLRRWRPAPTIKTTPQGREAR